MTSALSNPIYHNVIRYYGESFDVPHDIRRRRELTMETMRRMGTPVLIKHKFTIDDVSKEVAKEVGQYDTIYRETTHSDEASHGVGYSSVETQPEEWIGTDGIIHVAATPQTGWEPAPLYRGYGPGYLTYAILPDVPEDIFKLTPAGALLHTQVARAQLPWWPYCGDNDLLIVCELDPQENIIGTGMRYELKQVTPITMRGEDRLGEVEFNAPNLAGNRFWVGQQCETTKVPETDPIYLVEMDR